MTEVSSETVHASCVAIGDRAVLLEGRSGTGKSDLALRLIDRGAALVSDDYTLLVRRAGVLHARAPANLAGKMEVRGLGILAVAHRDEAPVALLVSLVEAPLRMPEPEMRRIAGVDVPVVRLAALEASAPIKVEHALARVSART